MIFPAFEGHLPDFTEETGISVIVLGFDQIIFTQYTFVKLKVFVRSNVT